MNQVSVLDTEGEGGGGGGIPGFPLLGEFFPSLNEALPSSGVPYHLPSSVSVKTIPLIYNFLIYTNYVVCNLVKRSCNFQITINPPIALYK